MTTWPFDGYALRAQVAPALISMFPALALGPALLSWDRFKITDGLAVLMITLLMFTVATFARDRGQRIQARIFPDGLPTLQWLRFRDKTLDADCKQRVLDFLCSKIKIAALTADHERLHPKAADRAYDQCLKWLRDNTRDPRFKLLMNENATYGFYRNLYGMKRISLYLGALTVLAVGALSAYRLWQNPNYDCTTLFVVLLVSAMHALYFLFVVTEDTVKRVAKMYAQELYGTAQQIMSGSESALEKVTAVPACSSSQMNACSQ